MARNLETQPENTTDTVPKRVRLVLESLKNELDDIDNYPVSPEYVGSVNQFAIDEMDEEEVARRLYEFLLQHRDGVDLSEHKIFRGLLTKALEMQESTN